MRLSGIFWVVALGLFGVVDGSAGAAMREPRSTAVVVQLGERTLFGPVQAAENRVLFISAPNLAENTQILTLTDNAGAIQAKLDLTKDLGVHVGDYSPSLLGLKNGSFVLSLESSEYPHHTKVLLFERNAFGADLASHKELAIGDAQRTAFIEALKNGDIAVTIHGWRSRVMTFTPDGEFKDSFGFPLGICAPARQISTGEVLVVGCNHSLYFLQTETGAVTPKPLPNDLEFEDAELTSLSNGGAVLWTRLGREGNVLSRQSEALFIDPSGAIGRRVSFGSVAMSSPGALDLGNGRIVFPLIPAKSEQRGEEIRQYSLQAFAYDGLRLAQATFSGYPVAGALKTDAPGEFALPLSDGRIQFFNDQLSEGRLVIAAGNRSWPQSALVSTDGTVIAGSREAAVFIGKGTLPHRIRDEALAKVLSLTTTSADTVAVATLDSVVEVDTVSRQITKKTQIDGEILYGLAPDLRDGWSVVTSKNRLIADFGSWQTSLDLQASPMSRPYRLRTRLFAVLVKEDGYDKPLTFKLIQVDRTGALRVASSFALNSYSDNSSYIHLLEVNDNRLLITTSGYMQDSTLLTYIDVTHSEQGEVSAKISKEAEVKGFKSFEIEPIWLDSDTIVLGEEGGHRDKPGLAFVSFDGKVKSLYVGSVTTQPALLPDGNLAIVKDDESIRILSPEGKEVGSFPLEKSTFSVSLIALRDGRLLLRNEDRISFLDSKTGAWQNYGIPSDYSRIPPVEMSGNGPIVFVNPYRIKPRGPNFGDILFVEKDWQ